MNPEDDQVVSPRSHTLSELEYAEDSSVLVRTRSLVVESMETPWLESPPTDRSVPESRNSSPGPVCPEFPDRHYCLKRSSPYLDSISKRSKIEFLERRGIRLNCCNKQESESGASSSASPKTPESSVFDSAIRVVAAVGKKEESSCELDRTDGWGPCSCGGRGGHDPEEIEFSRSYRIALSVRDSL